eukprot:TRINITY_DN7388_c1_g1_i2.p2 TRINITY_DN7388_c1_g1~~TRINITY_DN7388_c1_g1_i2.p2  ORF type:complete len:439 (+),score=181.12 TRINITY_DN7388_c1_g1_i2:91-1407(+)
MVHSKKFLFKEVDRLQKLVEETEAKGEERRIRAIDSFGELLLRKFLELVELQGWSSQGQATEAAVAMVDAFEKEILGEPTEVASPPEPEEQQREAQEQAVPLQPQKKKRQRRRRQHRQQSAVEAQEEAGEGEQSSQQEKTPLRSTRRPGRGQERGEREDSEQEDIEREGMEQEVKQAEREDLEHQVRENEERDGKEREEMEREEPAPAPEDLEKAPPPPPQPEQQQQQQQAGHGFVTEARRDSPEGLLPSQVPPGPPTPPEPTFRTLRVPDVDPATGEPHGERTISASNNPRVFYAEQCQLTGTRMNKQLAARLPSEPTDLKEVNLAHNYIGKKGIRAVFDIVNLCQCVRVVTLTDNKLDSEAVIWLCAIGRTHSSLSELLLESNLIAKAGGRALLALAQSNPRITRISLDNNPLLMGPLVRRITQQVHANRAAAGIE